MVDCMCITLETLVTTWKCTGWSADISMACNTSCTMSASSPTCIILDSSPLTRWYKQAVATINTLCVLRCCFVTGSISYRWKTHHIICCCGGFSHSDSLSSSYYIHTKSNNQLKTGRDQLSNFMQTGRPNQYLMWVVMNDSVSCSRWWQLIGNPILQYRSVSNCTSNGMSRHE